MAYDENYSNPFEGGSSLVFNGVDLGKECNMFVLGKGAFGAPSRDVTQIHIPGRNGDILIDNGGWNNVDVTYSSCCILSNFRENAAKLRSYLMANPGYHELTDPYNPDEVRYAEFRGLLHQKCLLQEEITPVCLILRLIASLSVSFVKV